MEVSTVNLVRGQFWIFNRTGFYGKGLIRNEMYISRHLSRIDEEVRRVVGGRIAVLFVSAVAVGALVSRNVQR